MGRGSWKRGEGIQSKEANNIKVEMWDRKTQVFSPFVHKHTAWFGLAYSQHLIQEVLAKGFAYLLQQI